ncbi:MAG: hypothetical protein ACI4DN_00055 [Lachnospiraceae bacterium]
MKRRNIFAAVCICSLGLALTGCGDLNVGQELTMTEEEQKLVTEYAANILMKYNAGSNMRVLSGRELLLAEAQEEAQKEQEEKRQQLAEEYQNSQGTKNVTTVSGNSSLGSSEAEMTAIEDLGSFFAFDSLSIVYQDYEITDSYGQGDEEIMMAMDATAGKKLLVAHFAVTNNSSETVQLDVLSREGKFRLKADGTTLQSQYTLLLNDLSMYKGDIEAGAVVDTVLIFELSQEQAEAESLSLLITLGDQRGSITLK